MAKDKLFTGSGVAIITPFKEDFSINYTKMEELIEIQIANKTDAIVVCGTTGEASAMSEQEQLDLIAFTVKTVNKRVPVIAGAGSNNTKKAVYLSKESERAGVDGILQVTPYYNKTTQAGLIAHFKEIATSVKTPIILYDVPARTAMGIAPDTYKELIKIPNIVATKDATGDISHVAQVKKACGDDLEIYSGNDDQITPILSLGGIGVISVAANIIPEEVHNICESFLSGKQKESTRLQLEYLSFINLLFSDTSPIPIKSAMNLIGMDVGPCRLPLVEMGEGNLNLLKKEMESIDLL